MCVFRPHSLNCHRQNILVGPMLAVAAAAVVILISGGLGAPKKLPGDCLRYAEYSFVTLTPSHCRRFYLPFSGIKPSPTWVVM